MTAVVWSTLRPLREFHLRGVAQLASALRSGRRGRRFKSGHPDISFEIFSFYRGAPTYH